MGKDKMGLKRLLNPNAKTYAKLKIYQGTAPEYKSPENLFKDRAETRQTKLIKEKTPSMNFEDEFMSESTIKEDFE